MTPDPVTYWRESANHISSHLRKAEARIADLEAERDAMTAWRDSIATTVTEWMIPSDDEDIEVTIEDAVVDAVAAIQRVRDLIDYDDPWDATDYTRGKCDGFDLVTAALEGP